MDSMTVCKVLNSDILLYILQIKVTTRTIRKKTEKTNEGKIKTKDKD